MVWSLGRRLIGLVAAYAIALQMLLAGGVVLASHAATAGVLCLGGIGGGSQPAPVPHHDGQQCCVAVGCHGAAAVVPDDSAPAPVRYADAIAHRVAATTGLEGIASARPHWPRAPPLI